MSGVQNYRLTTVTEAATCFDLTTLLNVKTDLEVDDGDASTDIYLQRVIRQASRSIAQYCNREFAKQTYQDVFRPQQDTWPVTLPNRLPVLTLKNFPVVSITSVVLQDGTILVAGTDYEIDLTTGTLRRLDTAGNPTGWTACSTTVIYVAGFDLPGDGGTDNPLLDFAPDIEDAAIRLVKARWAGKDRDPMLKSDEMTGVGRQEYWIPNTPDGNFPPEVQDILDNYRIMAIA